MKRTVLEMLGEMEKSAQREKLKQMCRARRGDAGADREH